MVYEPNFHELEYFVPFERGREALAAMRELMLAQPARLGLPDGGAHRRARARPASRTVTSGTPSSSPSRARRAPTTGRTSATSTGCSASFDARVHWGKLHFLTREQLRARYPRADDFVALRRELDPDGVFLNDHLRPLFG